MGLPAAGNIIAGKYRVVRVASAGRTSILLDAQHLELDRPAALAVLRVGVAAPEQIARFLDHARSVARIQSDHAARVLDIGELDDGCPFVAMDDLCGDDLAQLVETRGPLDPEEAVDLALQALEGLAAAHAVGVLHREIQPANLLVARGVLKVLDFRDAREAVALTPYTAPELVRDPTAFDPRSDVWSVGAVLYELLTGVPPFEGGPEALAAGILAGEPRDVADLRWDVPASLATVVMRCLRRDPAARYPDVDELAVALAPSGSGAEAPSVAKAQAALAKPPRVATLPSVPPVLQPPPPPVPEPPPAMEAGAGSLSAQIVAPVAAGTPMFATNAQLSLPPPAVTSVAPPHATPARRGNQRIRNATLVAAGVALACAGLFSARSLHRGSASSVPASPPPAVTTELPPAATAPTAATEPAPAPANPSPATTTEPASADDPEATPEPGGSARPGAHRGPTRRQILQRRQ